MFEFLSFELIVHDSAGVVVFRVVTWIITVMIGAVPALCENAPLHRAWGGGGAGFASILCHTTVLNKFRRRAVLPVGPALGASLEGGGRG